MNHINPDCKYYKNLSCEQCNKLGWGCRQGGLFLRKTALSESEQKHLESSMQENKVLMQELAKL